MSKTENTYKDYWTSVDAAASEVVEAVDEHGQEEDEALHEAADGAYWVIYTHAAARTMQYSDNSDAYWDETGGISAPGGCWSEVVCALAGWAHAADVRDRYARLRKETE